MEEDKEYRCGSCDTMTVSMEVEWGRMMTRDYDELFHDYTCCRCGGTLSLEADRKSNHKDYGDTIYVEGGYNEAFTCFGCGDIHSVRYTGMWKSREGIYGHEKDVEGEEGCSAEVAGRLDDERR